MPSERRTEGEIMTVTVWTEERDDGHVDWTIVIDGEDQGGGIANSQVFLESLDRWPARARLTQMVREFEANGGQS
jgi:hypothetical protein